ncbi:MAG TPA: helix-turn-helix domain-containing protein [Candidatus Angelobacter sp.]
MRSETEAKILEAAIELFAGSGYSASARDIAEKAGTTTMTMYRLFHNRKEYLFEEALRVVIPPLCPFLSERYRSPMHSATGPQPPSAGRPDTGQSFLDFE